MNRRGYLDWLRGVAVLIMIEAHTLDAWTRPADRTGPYGWAMVLAGYGAPLFMFLAGVSLMLGAGGRERRGAPDAEVRAGMRLRGWQVLGLAFLFRLQSWLVSGGSPLALLKVDILNVMGVSMLGASVIWGLCRSRVTRVTLFVGAALACTFITPLIRAADLLAMLPDPVEGYLRPVPGVTTFALFPWAGFLFAGAAAGLVLDASPAGTGEERPVRWIGGVGLTIAVLALLASYLPSIYPSSDFWTSSPTYFFVRLGLLMCLVLAAFVWNLRREGSPLHEVGRSSLFVYWVHVELVYGVVSLPLHRALPLPVAVGGFVLCTALMLLLVRASHHLAARWRGEGPRSTGNLQPVVRGM